METAGHESHETAGFSATWSRWVESHLWVTVASFFGTNLAWSYFATCGGLGDRDPRVPPLRALGAVLFVGLFGAVNGRIKNRATPFKVRCFLVVATLLFACSRVVQPWLVVSCAR